MKLLSMASLLALTLLNGLSHQAVASNLTTAVKLEAKAQQQHNRQREAGFKQTEQALLALKAKLMQQKQVLEQQSDQLAAQFSQNEQKIAKQETQLRLETGSLGELFGVVRQQAKSLDLELSHSVTGAGVQTHAKTVSQIVMAKQLPSMAQLKGLWLALQEQIIATGQLEKTEVTLVDGKGRKQPVMAQRIGAFALVSEQGYLNWSGAKHLASVYLKQPESAPRTSTLTGLLNGETEVITLDPSRGEILQQLALSPSLMDRFRAGGVVAQIIAGLFVLGLLIALVRGSHLLLMRRKIRQQQNAPQTPTNNPLGRVLAVYRQEKRLSVEALELRLLEVVMDEQTGLEKGLSMLKLLAALAPMLGLLGTVTGMIETFQVITEFGNGDPKVMAGGISMALVTTVLGLIAAMPLLLAHNILSSQAADIGHILEKQGIALVAEQAEHACVTAAKTEQSA